MTHNVCMHHEMSAMCVVWCYDGPGVQMQRGAYTGPNLLERKLGRAIKPSTGAIVRRTIVSAINVDT